MILGHGLIFLFIPGGCGFIFLQKSVFFCGEVLLISKNLRNLEKKSGAHGYRSTRLLHIQQYIGA